MIPVVNSAMMPAEGRYVLRRLSREEFVIRITEAHRRGELVSYVGYAETADHIARISGVPIPVSREPTQLDGPTTMLVCKLTYRVANPEDKGKIKPKPDDFEYYMADYSPL